LVRNNFEPEHRSYEENEDEDTQVTNQDNDDNSKNPNGRDNHTNTANSRMRSPEIPLPKSPHFTRGSSKRQATAETTEIPSALFNPFTDPKGAEMEQDEAIPTPIHEMPQHNKRKRAKSGASKKTRLQADVSNPTTHEVTANQPSADTNLNEQFQSRQTSERQPTITRPNSKRPRTFRVVHNDNLYYDCNSNDEEADVEATAEQEQQQRQQSSSRNTLPLDEGERRTSTGCMGSTAIPNQYIQQPGRTKSTTLPRSYNATNRLSRLPIITRGSSDTPVTNPTHRPPRQTSAANHGSSNPHGDEPPEPSDSDEDSEHDSKTDTSSQPPTDDQGDSQQDGNQKDDQSDQSVVSDESEPLNNELLSAETVISRHPRCAIPDREVTHSQSWERCPITELERGSIILALYSRNGNEMDAEATRHLKQPRLAYTPVENTRPGDASMLIELVMNKDNLNVPKLLWLSEDDFINVIVLSRFGVVTLSSNARSALESMGVSPKFTRRCPHQPRPEPATANNSTPTIATESMGQNRSNEPAGYQLSNDHPLFGNLLVRGMMHNKINSAQQTRLFDMLSLTTMLMGDHDLANRLTNCRMSVHDPIVLYQLLNDMPSYDKLRDCPVLHKNYLPQFLSCNFAARPITHMTGATSTAPRPEQQGILLDHFLPCIVVNGKNMIQQITSGPLGSEAIQNLRTIVIELLQLLKSKIPLLHQFYSTICSELQRVLQNRGEERIDEMPAKLIHKIANEHMYLIFKVFKDEIQRQANGSDNTTVSPQDMIDKVATVAKAHLSADNVEKYLNYNDTKLRKIAELVPMTIEGELIPAAVSTSRSPRFDKTNSTFRQKSPSTINYPTSKSKTISPNPVTTVPPYRRTTTTTNSANANPNGQQGQSRLKTDICISHLATSLKVPESKPCRHGDNCRLTHVTIPTDGNKLHAGTKAKIVATIEARYNGNSSTFKEHLLTALQTV
jgi:hypothetical protein